jgi:hypothetical protein
MGWEWSQPARMALPKLRIPDGKGSMAGTRAAPKQSKIRYAFVADHGIQRPKATTPPSPLGGRAGTYPVTGRRGIEQSP